MNEIFKTFLPILQSYWFMCGLLAINIVVALLTVLISKNLRRSQSVIFATVSLLMILFMVRATMEIILLQDRVEMLQKGKVVRPAVAQKYMTGTAGELGGLMALRDPANSGSDL